MATISAIRAAIAEKLETIDGLNTYRNVPGSMAIPAAVVFGPEINYDTAVRSDEYRFSIVFYVSRTSESDGQDRLDDYLEPAGVLSTKAAVEADVTLGGLVDSVYVESVGDYGPQEANGILYIGASQRVRVMVTR